MTGTAVKKNNRYLSVTLFRKNTHSSVIKIQGTNTSFVGEMMVTSRIHDEKGLYMCRDDVDSQPALHRFSYN